MVQAERRKYHYIYKTTCLITNKFYIGMHSTDDLNDGYKGSGSNLWKSINKHGLENHSTEILEFLTTRKDLKEREKQIVNEELIGNKLCMNLKLGGDGGWDHLNSNSEVQRKKGEKGNASMKWLSENDPAWVVKKAEKSRIAIQKRIDAGLHTGWPKDIWNGKKHSEETIQKMKDKKIGQGLGESNSQFGTCWIHSLIERKSQKINKSDIETWISVGWILGRKLKFPDMI